MRRAASRVFRSDHALASEGSPPSPNQEMSLAQFRMRRGRAILSVHPLSSEAPEGVRTRVER